MALYIPHIIFHLARLLYVRPETFGPYYVSLCSTISRILKRIALFLGSQKTPACASDTSRTETMMSMEQWRNDTDRRKPMYSEKNLSHCHFVHNMEWNSGHSVDSPANNVLSNGSATEDPLSSKLHTKLGYFNLLATDIFFKF